MTIYPAIDLKGGRCVRLRQGNAQEETDYGDPLEAAHAFGAAGARWIHMVDLDGAFTGDAANESVVAAVTRIPGLSVQLGGGIRSMKAIEKRLVQMGVARVVLGTIALENSALVQSACAEFPGRIACGIDARAGKVAVQGWTQQTEMDALELACRMREMGVQVLIYTDIARDGMLSGPNITATRQMVEGSGMQVIGSGGVGKLSDLAALREAGCAGAIIGRALYSGQFTLREAIGEMEGRRKDGTGPSTV